MNALDYQVTKVELNVVQVEPTRSQPGRHLNQVETSRLPGYYS